MLLIATSRDRLLDRDDLPEPDEFAEYVGGMRASVSRDGDDLVVRHVGALGGPLVMAWLLLVGPNMGPMGASLSGLEQDFSRHLLTQAGEAIACFEQQNGRRPRDLAELYVAAAWPDEALLLPVDDQAEEVVLPGGRKVRTSFRYYPDAVTIERFGRPREGLLLQIRPMFGRVMLGVDGKVASVYGAAAKADIDSFDK